MGEQLAQIGWRTGVKRENTENKENMENNKNIGKFGF